MNAASDSKDRVLEFSRTYFGEAERGEGLMGHTWSASTDSRPGDKPRWEGVSPISGATSAAWGRVAGPWYSGTGLTTRRLRPVGDVPCQAGVKEPGEMN